MIRKRSLTLIEVLISASLLVLLLSTLFGTYFTFVKSQRVLEKRETQAFQELYLQTRLAEVFSKMAPEIVKGGAQKKEQSTYFYFSPASHGVEGTGSLTFTYFNGTGAGPDFSNQVIGKIFVDKAGRLILLTWPWIERELKQDEIPGEKFRMEVLTKEITSATWNIYRAPTKESKGKTIDPEGIPDRTKENAEEKELPTVIELRLNGKTPFYFPVPNPQNPVYYP